MTVPAPTSPLVTTIIPTYRRPQLLRRAIESALRQEGTPLSVCVFDNASGDETEEVVREICSRDARLQYHRHAQNIGGAANFEYGLRSVRTPFFSLLSDDDYLLPGFYRQALADLERNPQAMFWAGLTLTVDESGKIWYSRVDEWPREGLFAPPGGAEAMLHGKFPVWTSVVFRREILDGIGFPDWDTLGPSDLDFIIKAAASYEYVLRKYPSAVFTLHDTSFSSSQPLSSFWPGWQKMFLNIERNEALDPGSKARILHGMHQDARHMLFRRAANALAGGRRDFSGAAVQAFRAQYGGGFRPWLMEFLTKACGRFPWFQAFYTWSYRRAEQAMVRSRTDLESRFGHLIQRQRP